MTEATGIESENYLGYYGKRVVIPIVDWRAGKNSAWPYTLTVNPLNEPGQAPELHSLKR
jgi:hypothetical protein